MRARPNLKIAALAAIAAAPSAMIGATVNRVIVAPTTAPPTCAPPRSATSRGPGTAGESPVESDADDRRCQHGGAELLDAELACGRVLAAERHSQAGDQDQPAAVVVIKHTGAGQHRQHRQHHHLEASAAVSHDVRGVEMAGELAEHRAGQEADERDDRGRHVDPGVRHEPEAEEDHVAGHVRDEYVAEDQDTDGVDQSGGESQQQQRDDGDPLRHWGCDGHGVAPQSGRQVQRGDRRHLGDQPLPCPHSIVSR